MLMLLLIIVLIVLLAGGAFGYANNTVTPTNPLGIVLFILVVVVAVALITGPVLNRWTW